MWVLNLLNGGTCTKAGESPLQGDCGEFDSFYLHTSNNCGWLGKALLNLAEYKFIFILQVVSYCEIICYTCLGSQVVNDSRLLTCPERFIGSNPILSAFWRFKSSHGFLV